MSKTAGAMSWILAVAALAGALEAHEHAATCSCGWSFETNRYDFEGSVVGKRGVNLLNGNSVARFSKTPPSLPTPENNRGVTVNYFINLTSSGVGNLTHVGQTLEPIDESLYLGVGTTADTIARAVESWNVACGINLVRVFNHTQAQMKIGERTLPGSTVGLGGFTASSQGQGFFITGGFVQLDKEVTTAGTWTTNFLLTVTAHEIGHAIGLQHTNISSLMFPSVGAIVGPAQDEMWWTQAGLYGRAQPSILNAVDNSGQVTVSMRKVAQQMTGTTSDQTFQGSAPAPFGPGVGTGALTQNNVLRYELQRKLDGQADGTYVTVNNNIQAGGGNNANPSVALASNTFTAVDMSVPASGNYRYRYRAVYENSGNDTFSAERLVAVTVVDATRPVANNDMYAVAEDGFLIVNSATGVLNNDDAKTFTLTAVLVNDVQNGDLTLNADGSFTYDPDPNFFGNDTFTYFAQNDNIPVDMSMMATVTIMVNSVNDAPVTTDWFMNIQEDTSASDSLSVAVTDPDGAPPAYALLNDVDNGTLTFNSATGAFSYTPDTEFSGMDSFDWRANDGNANSNTSTVWISVTPVNDNPFAVISAPASGTVTVMVDEVVNFAGAGSSDDDGTVDIFHWDFADGDTADISSGTSAIGATTHAFDTPGSYVVTLVVEDNDQGLSAADTVTIEVIGGAGDANLALTKGTLTINHAKPNADILILQGVINPGQLPANLGGLVVALTLNGTPYGPVGALDAAGKFVSPAGSSPMGTYSIAAKGGKFSFTLKLADLADIVGISNATFINTNVLDIGLNLSRVSPAFDMDFVAQPEFTVTSTVNKSAKGTFALTKNRLLSGAFLATKASVKEVAGGHTFVLSGFLTPGGGAATSLNLGGNGIDLTIDGDSFNIPPSALNISGAGTTAVFSLNTKAITKPPEAAKFQISNSKKTFALTTTALATGVPTAGGATAYDVPVMVEIEIASGDVVSFDATVTIVRTTNTATSWKGR
ncbi:MAG: tandem-95 repeat protein [Planctomycetes bacterium]|nr:tandem-95 repeat protein [Planctomycetota bacterium]